MRRATRQALALALATAAASSAGCASRRPAGYASTSPTTRQGRAPLAAGLPGARGRERATAPPGGAVPCSSLVERAQRIAPRARAAEALAAVARARRAEARAGYLPETNAAALGTVGFPGSGGNLGVRGMMNSPFVRNWAAGLEASWSVLEVVRIEPRVEITRAEEAAARAEEARSEREVGLMVVDLCERAVVADASLAAFDADLVARREGLRALEALEAAGTTPATDVLQARAGLRGAEAARIAAAADLAGIRAVLGVLTGDPAVAGATVALDAPEPRRSDPEAAAARANRMAAGTWRDLPWRQLVPRVTLGGSVGYANTPEDVEPGLWAAGASVVVPFTEAWIERQRSEAAALTAESRAREWDGRAQDVAVRRATLRAELAGLEPALEAAESSRAAAAEAAGALAARAGAGLVRGLELEAARLSAVQAAVHEATVRARIDGAKARLSLLGGP